MKRSSIGSSTSSSHSSSATTHISLSSLKDADQFLKSPRFSPIPKYDRYFRGIIPFIHNIQDCNLFLDKLLQVNS